MKKAKPIIFGLMSFFFVYWAVFQIPGPVTKTDLLLIGLYALGLAHTSKSE